MKTIYIKTLVMLILPTIAFTQNTSINMGMGVNISETETYIENTNVNFGFGIHVNETQVQPTQVIVVHETTPVYQAPAPVITNCVVYEQEFNQILTSIENKDFDQTKLDFAKQIISNKCFNSAQMKKIVKCFDFEDSRLEIAKYGYRHVSDPSNYYIVSDAFDFSSSVDELNEYMAN